MYLTKTIWITAIACAALLLVTVLAATPRPHVQAFPIAVAAVPAPEELDVRVPAIEYDPAVSALYPTLGALGGASDRSF
jgi:hypothetical protein